MNELKGLEKRLRDRARDLDADPSCCDLREIAVLRGVANQLRDIESEREPSIPESSVLDAIESLRVHAAGQSFQRQMICQLRALLKGSR